jgi:hypothetical protein
MENCPASTLLPAKGRPAYRSSPVMEHLVASQRKNESHLQPHSLPYLLLVALYNGGDVGGDQAADKVGELPHHLQSLTIPLPTIQASH